MKSQNEIEKINQFLCMVSPPVIAQVKMLLQSAGLTVIPTLLTCFGWLYVIDSANKALRTPRPFTMAKFGKLEVM